MERRLEALKTSKPLLILLLSLLAVVAPISGFVLASPPAHANQSTVMISETPGSGSPSGAPGYSPDLITVVIGVNNTVEWTNNDVGHNHTVNSFVVPQGAKSFSSGNMVKNATFTVTLTVPGLYRYGCTYHPWMAGDIDVVAAPNSGATTTGILSSNYLVVAAILVVIVVAVILVFTRLRSRPSRPTPSPVVTSAPS